ncbi:MAG: hypothetical protein ACUVXI_16615 [bacterium]
MGGSESRCSCCGGEVSSGEGTKFGIYLLCRACNAKYELALSQGEIRHIGDFVLMCGRRPRGSGEKDED